MYVYIASIFCSSEDRHQGLREHNHGEQSWDAGTHLTSGTPMHGREEGGYRISGALWSSA